MPAFPEPKRPRKRRANTIRRVSLALGVHERTLRRWMAIPGLQAVLRVVQHGGRQRLDAPGTVLALARYKRDVLRAMRPFRRKCEARDSWAAEAGRKMGYGIPLRERGLRILHAATVLKLAEDKVTSVFKAKSKLAERTCSDRSTALVGSARIIAAKYGCEVFEVPKHLDREEPTRENKRLRQQWPTREQWDRAAIRLERLWRERTLAEAALTLAKLNRPISGVSLARLVFLNEYREQAWKVSDWKANQKHPENYFKPPGNYGRRGISLRLFRQRYTVADIRKATAVALGTTLSEPEEDGSAPRHSRRAAKRRQTQHRD